MSTCESDTKALAEYLKDFESELLRAYEDRISPFLEAHGAELDSETADQLTALVRDLGDLACTLHNVRHNDLRLLLKSLRQATALAQAA